MTPSSKTMLGKVDELRSANVAQIIDAQLFVTYTKLFQTLSPSDQIAG